LVPVHELTAPSEEDARDLPQFLTQFLVPPDLQHSLAGDAPLILEVDPYTAIVPWEFLMARRFDGAAEPLAIRQCLARQMRTTYARTDVDEPSVEGMKALVVGDPGDPARGQALPHARTEAVAVAAVLRKHKIEPDLLIGAPGTLPTTGARFATRLDVLARMLTGNYDIVHYSGHGVFDPAHPELSGWLFADGLLAARELAQFTRAPRLVMANACWSAARPDMSAAGEPEPGRQGELAPVLADEFLRVGTGHFVGATWRLPDRSAEEFATLFYDALFGAGPQRPVTVGEALRRSRQQLWEAAQRAAVQTAEQRSAWAAYEHYGDPGDYLVPTAAGRPR
jgi:CHAT domain-containing protein